MILSTLIELPLFTVVELVADWSVNFDTDRVGTIRGIHAELVKVN